MIEKPIKCPIYQYKYNGNYPMQYNEGCQSHVRQPLPGLRKMGGGVAGGGSPARSRFAVSIYLTLRLADEIVRGVRGGPR